MYDVAIIGLGCAGYTAAIYSARYKLRTLIVGETEGGMGITAAEVGNWPGDQEIKGPDLMNRMKEHAISFESVTHKILKVEKVKKVSDGFTVLYQDGSSDNAKTVIFATGSNKRKMGVPGEEEFAGKGVSYCATCDAFFFKNKDVAVIGGGDSAVEGAAIVAQVAKNVYLVHRRSEFRAEPFWVDEVNKKDNVTFVLERNMVAVLGDGKVTGIKLDKKFGDSDMINVNGVFIEIGTDPAVNLVKGLGCKIDDRGHLSVDNGMHSSIDGVFGAGDVTNGSSYFAQFTTAAGEGAIAAHSVFAYLQAKR